VTGYWRRSSLQQRVPNTRSITMKEVRKEELDRVQGGAELAGTVGDTLPFPVVPLPGTPISDTTTLAPTLPQKHVET
jgi:hypothetical protein